MAVINGQKAGFSSISSDVTAIKAVTDALVTGVTETTATFSYDETSAAEQTAIELTISARSEIGAIWLDMVNVTQNTTVRAYHKTDGTNYRLFQENAWITTDDDGVLINGFTAYRDVKVTLQCGGGGAGSVNVPTAVV